MKDHLFQVGDKVVLAYKVGRLTIVPQLVPGRVYCVSAVATTESALLGTSERVWLVGVRGDRRHKNPRRKDDSLCAAYFRRVAGSSTRQDQKEVA